MATKNSTDKLKGRKVKKGLPKTKPTAKERARAEKVQDKPKKTAASRKSSHSASSPKGNVGKMEGASGTRNASDKGQTAKKMTNARAASTKRKLKDNIKKTGQPGQATAKKAAETAAKKKARVATAKKVAKAVARVGGKAVAPVGLLTEGILAANKLADKRSPQLKSQVKKASASQKARRNRKK